MKPTPHSTTDVWNIRFGPQDSNRGILRRILSQYLDCSPESIRFEHNENGKPFLPESDICFNLSHSRDRLLIAVTAGREVGIDIEFRRGGINMAAIAGRWFSAAEQEFFQTLLALSGVEGEKPEIGFFDIWSKKEAFVKAQGLGIFHGLADFTVPFGTDPEVPMFGSNEDWFFQCLEIDPAYSAAVVSQTPVVPVQKHEFHV